MLGPLTGKRDAPEVVPPAEKAAAIKKPRQRSAKKPQAAEKQPKKQPKKQQRKKQKTQPVQLKVSLLHTSPTHLPSSPCIHFGSHSRER